MRRFLMALIVGCGLSALLQAQSIFPSSGFNISACTTGWVLYKSSGDPCNGAFLITASGTGSQYATVSALSGPAVKIGVDDVNGNGSLLVLGSNGDNASSPQIRFYSSQGTNAAPTAANNGSTMGQIQALGYDGAVFRQTSRIQANVVGTVSSGIVPGQLSFFVTDTSAVSQRMIDLNGNTGYVQFASPNGLDLFSGDLLLNHDGTSIKTDTTTAHTACFASVYDVNGTAYTCGILGTNGDTPTLNVTAPTGGTMTVQPTTYKSSDGSTGVTVSACTSFKNGLCVVGT